MDASQLFSRQPVRGIPASPSGLARDSRAVASGDAFVAIGADAATHARAAVAAGATVVVSEGDLASGAIEWSTPHARYCFARANAVRTGCDRLTQPLLAVTGTKGKTSTAWAAWWALGPGAARVGTVGWHDGRSERPAVQTTPPPEELHAFLAGLASDCPGIALEASSHAADQQRLAGLPLTALAVTGIGRDHLDYHGTMAAYVAAKLDLVHHLRPGGLLIVNADDARAATFIHAGQAVGARVMTLGFAAGELRLRPDGTQWRLHAADGDLVVPCALPGRFNVFNLAVGALLAEAAGVPLPTALARLATMPGIPGRLERCAEQPVTYVDYAHTADSLALVVEALRERHPGRKVVMVFGCGGDRDRGKRGPMGRAALTADIAVLTTDNPRREDPAAIVADVRNGCGDASRLIVEHDRRAAIALARREAGPDGVVAVCGKGHETEQIVGRESHHFDDRAVVRELAEGA